ncbi:MAG: ribosome recycling factor [bacterium]
MAFDQIKNLQVKMQEVIDFFQRELSKIRTGRANPAIVEDIKVSYYGNQALLKTIASISVPEANLITIQPWDAGAINDIETAISDSDLGLSVVNDGKVIRLTVPPMTAERRGDLSKLIEKIAEENKVKLRNLRREVWDNIQSDQKQGKISEDDKYTAQKELQDLIQKFEDIIKQELTKKQNEIKQV